MVKKMNRRHFLKQTGIGLTMLSTPFAAAKNLSRRQLKPNIIIILADDLGYGDLSCQGATDLRTPHIDQLFRSGMKFNNFYANCSVCSPTRASILTGRYPDLVGVPGVIRTHPTNNFGYLSPQAILLPSLLKAAGYETAIVGKWHRGLASPNLPNERGFDYFYGFLGDMMDDYYHHRRHDINYMRLNKAEIAPEGHATDIFSQSAVNYIREHQNAEPPFFLYLAYNAPHTPIQPPETWLTKVKDRGDGVDEKRAKLMALIEHLDAGIGAVLQTLKATGQFENTLIFFSSDNGGQLDVGARNGQLHGGKQNLYEGGIKVPMCAVWPGKIQANSTANQIGISMDIFATICEAAGISLMHEIDGMSLLPILNGRNDSLADRTLFWVRREGSGYGGLAYYAAR